MNIQYPVYVTKCHLLHCELYNFKLIGCVQPVQITVWCPHTVYIDFWYNCEFPGYFPVLQRSFYQLLAPEINQPRNEDFQFYASCTQDVLQNELQSQYRRQEKEAVKNTLLEAFCIGA